MRGEGDVALARSSESAWTTCANEMRKRTIVIPQLETGDMRQVDGQIRTTFPIFDLMNYFYIY